MLKVLKRHTSRRWGCKGLCCHLQINLVVSLKPSPYLPGEFAATLGQRHGVKSVHLLHLLLPHPLQGVGGNVKVRQLVQEQREELIFPDLHWRNRENIVNV